MEILDLLLRSGTYVLALAIFVLTFFTRRSVELLIPTWKKQADANAPDVTYLTMGSRWWNEVVLYAVPVVLGVLISLVPSEFIFGGFDGGARVMYGGGVGWLSGFLYKAMKKALKGRLGIELPTNSGVSGGK